MCVGKIIAGVKALVADVRRIFDDNVNELARGKQQLLRTPPTYRKQLKSRHSSSLELTLCQTKGINRALTISKLTASVTTMEPPNQYLVTRGRSRNQASGPAASPIPRACCAMIL